MKKVTIKAAKEIGEKYKQDGIIILSFKKLNNIITVTTWGKSIEGRLNAANAGNFYREILGLSLKKCTSVPAKIKKLKT